MRFFLVDRQGDPTEKCRFDCNESDLAASYAGATAGSAGRAEPTASGFATRLGDGKIVDAGFAATRQTLGVGAGRGNGVQFPEISVDLH